MDDIIINKLQHNGVLFPEEYKPHKLKLANDNLKSLAEEMLYAYSLKDLSKIDKNVLIILNKNFYECLKRELTTNQLKLKFPDDYNIILETLRGFKPVLTPEEKKKKSEDFKKLKEKYNYAIVNDKKELLGNYIIEPPGIFMGRGNSPYTGLWKYRTEPEDVVINIINSDIPKAPKGHEWKEVINKNVTYIAYYKINLGNKMYIRKEVRFNSNSSIISSSDDNKYKKADKLLDNWDFVQNEIIKSLNSSNQKIKECALISWLIQYTSIRVGSEENENGVVGALTLKCKNIKINEDKQELNLNFIGKDSINYNQTFKVPDYIISTLETLMKDKTENENVFNVSYENVNKFLSEVLEDLSAKVFRTAWANKILMETYEDMKIKKSAPRDYKILQLKLLILNTSLKLNHKKATTKILKDTLDKIEDKIKKLKEKIKEDKDEKRKTKRKWQLKTLELKFQFVKDSYGFNLSTALTNYINPKNIKKICDENDIPIEKIYSKALISRFNLSE